MVENKGQSIYIFESLPKSLISLLQTKSSRLNINFLELVYNLIKIVSDRCMNLPNQASFPFELDLYRHLLFFAL